jgi:hypothetical protein
MQRHSNNALEIKIYFSREPATISIYIYIYITPTRISARHIQSNQNEDEENHLGGGPVVKAWD